jgi:hypothetical protein
MGADAGFRRFWDTARGYPLKVWNDVEPTQWLGKG